MLRCILTQRSSDVVTPEVQIYRQARRNFLRAYFDKLSPRLIPFATLPSVYPLSNVLIDSTEAFLKIASILRALLIVSSVVKSFEMLFKSSSAAFARKPAEISFHGHRRFAQTAAASDRFEVFPRYRLILSARLFSA